MKCLGIIPVRMSSQRLPGKPLVDLGGKTLVERVFEQASRSELLTELYVSTDSKEIIEFCESKSIPLIITSSECRTGSDRVAEAFQSLKLSGKNFDLIANIQGDMPFINPSVIDGTIKTLADSTHDFEISTAAYIIETQEEFNKDSVVKVVLGSSQQALYFSRAPIPFIRNPESLVLDPEHPLGHRHIGLYVFRPDTLLSLSTLASTLSEERESLEQLRALSSGIKIRVFVGSRALFHPSIEVDTEADVQAARAYLEAHTGKL